MRQREKKRNKDRKREIKGNETKIQREKERIKRK